MYLHSAFPFFRLINSSTSFLLKNGSDIISNMASANISVSLKYCLPASGLKLIQINSYLL